MLKPIEGTILTVVRESADGGRARRPPTAASLADVLRAARDAGRGVAGRDARPAAVLNDAGVVDAGGAGFLLLLDAALHVVDGEPLPEPPTPIDGRRRAFDAVAQRRRGVDGELDVSEQRYEVMFLFDLADERIERLQAARGARSATRSSSSAATALWNCHVHTNDIGAAIEAALDLDGRPCQIRVTDLFEEVAAEHAQREAAIARRRRRPATADGCRRSRARSSPSAAGRASPSCSASSACRASSAAARR